MSIQKPSMKGLVDYLADCNVIKTQQVYNSMLQVDRGDFISPKSYYDNPQSIGFNTTISAPHMHAHALEYLSPFLKPNIHILDVGSGSGYLTVALSKMINDTGLVVGVDHIQEIIDYSINNINKHHSNLLKEKKIIIEKCDGRNGCLKYAPYKVIHVGAASPTVPVDLIKQLDYGGRMFIPVGKEGDTQWLSIVDKDLNGKITQEKVMGVCYVPLTTPEKQLNRYK